MATLRKLRETELLGGISNEDLYPITSALGVYTKEGKLLQNFINDLNKTYVFGGIASPDSTPVETGELKVFYLALEAGTYIRFNNFTLGTNALGILIQTTEGWDNRSMALGTGGGGGAGYVLPKASDAELGGIKTGYSQNGKNYPVNVDAEGNAYVYVPWKGGNPEPGVVPVTGVSLPESVSVVEGSSTTLTPSISPSNATNKQVTWKSDRTDIVSVSNGRVTGISGGTAVITVTTVDGNFSDTCTVNVTPKPPDKYGYFGVVDNDFEITEQNIKDTVEQFVSTSRAYTSKNVAMDYQKTLYAYPKAYGELESIKDGNGFEYLLSYTKSEITVNGEVYYVYILTDAATIPMFKQTFA